MPKPVVYNVQYKLLDTETKPEIGLTVATYQFSFQYLDREARGQLVLVNISPSDVNTALTAIAQDWAEHNYAEMYDSSPFAAPKELLQ